MGAALAIGALSLGGLACGEKDEPDLSTVPQTETAPATTTQAAPAPTTTAPVAPAP